jgi:hypothetical protein
LSAPTWKGEQFPSSLEYTNGCDSSVFPSMVWTVFPSVLLTVNSVRGRGIVPSASGIHRQTQIVSVSIGVFHSEWQIIFVFLIYPSYKYLNWKLHAQHNNISSHNNYKINTSLLRILSITITLEFIALHFRVLIVSQNCLFLLQFTRRQLHCNLLRW